MLIVFAKNGNIITFDNALVIEARVKKVVLAIF